MSFPSYQKYTDSGVNWLGHVPEHWRVGAIKYFVLPKNGAIKTGPFGSHLTSAEMQSGPFKVYNQRTVIDGDFDDGDNFISEEKFAELASFETFPGDLLITTRGTIGRAAILPQNAERGILHSCLLRLQPDNSQIDTLFLKTLIQDSSLMKTQLSYLSNATTIEVIYSETIASVIIPVPPICEQRTILEFLDRETTKIDALVGEQRRLIELLKEKRQSVISHAVTKGLNPHAPMKPSGMEWLGDVPEHWKVTQLGRICSDINDINHEMPTAVENGVPFLSAKDLLDDGTLNFTVDIKMISEEDFVKLSRKICPRRGDIIYSRIGACLGKARLVETDARFLISYSCCVVRVEETIACRQFIRHLLDGEMILTEARMRTQGIGVPDLGLREIGRFPVPLPPMREQTAIASYLEDEVGKLERLIAEAQRAIDLLQERRTALISAAVTGKIDVRGLAESEAA